MVRNYTKKSSRGEWDKNAMMAALTAVAEGRMTTFAAANAYKVPATTLRRRLKKNDDEMPVHGGRFREVFDESQLECLKKYLTAIDRTYSGMTKQQCRRLVFDFAEHCKISHPFNRETKMAGEDWLANFMKHFKLGLRPPEATTAARTIDFTEPTVDELFTVLREAREKYKFPACAVYNADESGPSRATDESSESTTERGKHVSVVRFVNATGTYLPAFLAFSRKRFRPALVERSPQGTARRCTELGWSDGEEFVQFLNDFGLQARPTAEFPVVLLVDDETPVTRKAVDLGRENHIVVLGFPPRAPKRPEQPRKKRNIAAVLDTPYRQAAAEENAASAFRDCWIGPCEDYNPLTFSEQDLDPWEMSDQSLAVDKKHDGRASSQAATSGPAEASDELPLGERETEPNGTGSPTSQATNFRPGETSDRSAIDEDETERDGQRRCSTSTLSKEPEKSKSVFRSKALPEATRAKKRKIQKQSDSGVTKSPVEMMLARKEEWKTERKCMKRQRKETRASNVNQLNFPDA